MKTIAIASFCAAIILAGCAAKVPPVASHVDMGGRRTDFIPANLLDAGNTRELIWLNASRVFHNATDFDYFLEIRYQATEERGFLDVRPGESLVISADGKELKFESFGSMNQRREKKGIVTEDAIYRATGDAIRKIAYAKQVRVKVIGQNGIVVRDFAPENFEKFREFADKFVG